MGDNLKLRKLRLDLMDVLNEAVLPTEAKRNILELILVELNKLAEQDITKEIAEMQKEETENDVDCIGDSEGRE